MKFGSSHGLRRPSKLDRSGCPSGERDHRVRGAGDREDANDQPYLEGRFRWAHPRAPSIPHLVAGPSAAIDQRFSDDRLFDRL
jgi:hypothetical protein